MPRNEMINLTGVVKELLPNLTFKVILENGKEVTAYLSGKLRMHFIRIAVGDSVDLEMSPYDPTKARIVWRIK